MHGVFMSDQLTRVLCALVCPQGTTSNDSGVKVETNSISDEFAFLFKSDASHDHLGETKPAVVSAEVSKSGAQDSGRQLADDFGFLFQESITSGANTNVGINQHSNSNTQFRDGTQDVGIVNATNPFNAGLATGFTTSSTCRFTQPPLHQADPFLTLQPAPSAASWGPQDPFRDVSQAAWNR